MKIVIIGSGNVAYHLAKAFVLSGIEVSQLFGRNEKELEIISKELKIPYSVEELKEADLYIISVSDKAVSVVSEQIISKNCLVVHTSGAVSMDDLKGDYRKGVFYPLQTFSKNKNLDYSVIPFFIEADNLKDYKVLENLALKISKKVSFADGIQRKYIHLTAVFACNFTNHLFARAKEIADSQNIPFDYFLPLIDETTRKIHEIEPKLAQTGPAIRKDKKVLLAHQQLLQDDELLKIYNILNESIKKMYEL